MPVSEMEYTLLQSDSHCQLSEVFTPFTKYFSLYLTLPVTQGE